MKIYLVLLLVLTAGCLGQSEEIKTQNIGSILSNPSAYGDEEINFKATVIQIYPYQQGVLLKLQDDTGEINAFYTGNVMTVDVGYEAIFTGVLVQDQSMASAHGSGSGVLLSITGIKDVVPGKLEETVPPYMPPNMYPTIAELRENRYAYSMEQAVTIVGKCLQTQNAAGYTYVELEDDTGKMWVAIPESEIEIGKVYIAEGIVMTDFTSKTTGKTFDVILFSAGLKPFSPHGSK